MFNLCLTQVFLFDYLKVLLYKNKPDQELHPVAIRITQNRSSKYMFTGIYIKEEYWDKEGEKVKKLYRHSDLRTTIGYQVNFINKLADEALDAVINF